MGNFIDECYGTAQRILEDNVDKLHAMADALMQYETIDSDQIDDIMAGRTVREPSGWSDRDDGDNASGAGAGADDAERDSGNPIGGPAGEH